MNTRDRDQVATLEILQAIEEEKGVTQRRLAKRLGVALGLTNSYLKRCARKGLIKVQQAPANRYLYYLTPKGFAEKGRLTAQYLAYSLDFYRRAGRSCDRLYRECRAQGWNRVLLCGLSDLAEIAAMRALEFEVETIGVFAPQCGRERFLGRPVFEEWPDPLPADACLVTDLADPPACWRGLLEHVPAERILVPGILGLRTATEG